MIRPVLRFGRDIVKSIVNRSANFFNPPVVVLIYHRVTTLTSDPQLLAVSPENFRAQIKYLKNTLPLLRFEEDWAGVQEPSIAITFDDGYADNVIEALSIMEEEQVPATFFISTGYVGSDEEFWWDELEKLLLIPTETPSEFKLRDQAFVNTWPTGSTAARKALYDNMHVLMKSVDTPVRDNWLWQLREWAGSDLKARTTHRPVSYEELCVLAGSCWAAVGAHTVSHPVLAVLSPERQRQEIMESREQLAYWLKKEVPVFSYPFGGKQDYTVTTVNIAKEAGFRRVAANVPGQWHQWTDPWQTPRQLVRNWDIETFKKMLQRFWIL